MKTRKTLSLAALFLVMGFVSWLFAQADDPLERGRELYKKGNYTEAVKVLESFARAAQGFPLQAKKLAEANYLLAKIYYEAGDDRQVESYLAKALQSDREIDRDETVEAFKSKVEKLRASLPDLGPKAGDVKKVSVNGVEFDLVWIPPGEFMMGSPSWEPGRESIEGPQHKVKISRGFWLGKYEATLVQWQALNVNNPSHFKNAGPNAPVEQVSWNDVQEFLQNLNARVGGGFRLPSEAEWEYACRAGTMTPIYTGNLTILGDNNGPELDPIAWYRGNSGVDYARGWNSSKWPGKQYNHRSAGTHTVGRKQPNAWGLHDMLGNVWEWCQDWYGQYSEDEMIDPSGPSFGNRRVRRGGSWFSVSRFHRVTYRSSSEPGLRDCNLGFRFARVQ